MNNEKLSQQEIVSAHEALSTLFAYSTSTLPERVAKGYLNEILKALPPEPQLTMADIDWEHSKHFLAVAEDTRDKQRLIMLFPEVNGLIRCIRGEGLHSYTETILREYLVPTGQLYTLVDNQE